MKNSMQYVGFGTRQLSSGIHVMTGCFETRIGENEFHTHLSAYLTCGDRGSALIDTGHVKDFNKIASYIESVVGKDLTYIFPTHEEYPHSGNLGLLLEAFPEAVVIGETRNLHLYYPDQYRQERFLQKNVGERIDLGGRTLEILPALIHDLPASYWAYDDRDKTLFVSDGFAFSHYDSAECVLLSHELPKPPTAAEARLILDLALYWSRYADNTAIVTDLAEMLQKYETRMICPAHGSVITEPGKLLAVMEAAMRSEIRV